MADELDLVRDANATLTATVCILAAALIEVVQ